MPAVVALLLGCVPETAQGQQVPSVSENLAYLTTFGKRASASWGDDDHCQTFFFYVPPEHENPVYIRVFDPETSGELDMKTAAFNTRTKFTVYGGQGAHSEPDARWIDPRGKYKSGPLQTNLEMVMTSDEYWYSWKLFHPRSELIRL